MAVKYLDDKIRNSNAANNSSGVSVTEGIKHLTTWMKAQRDAGAGAEKSGLNQYIETFLNTDYGYGVGSSTDTTGQAIDDFLNDFQTSNGQTYVNGLNLTDDDTGSVAGSEYSGPILKSSDVVDDDPSYISGYTSQLTYVEEDNDDPVTILVSAEGIESTLNSIPSVSFGDTNTYNLMTAQSATLTIKHIDSLLESVATVRASVGSNFSVTQNTYDSLRTKITNLELAVSRTSDVSIQEETVKLAKSNMLSSMNLSMMVQANQITAEVTLSLHLIEL